MKVESYKFANAYDMLDKKEYQRLIVLFKEFYSDIEGSIAHLTMCGDVVEYQLFLDQMIDSLEEYSPDHESQTENYAEFIALLKKLSDVESENGIGRVFLEC